MMRENCVVLPNLVKGSFAKTTSPISEKAIYWKLKKEYIFINTHKTHHYILKKIYIFYINVDLDLMFNTGFEINFFCSKNHSLKILIKRMQSNEISSLKGNESILI